MDAGAAVASVESLFSDMLSAKTEGTLAKAGIDLDDLTKRAVRSGDAVGTIVAEIMAKTKGDELALSKLFKSETTRDLIRSIHAAGDEFKETWTDALSTAQQGTHDMAKNAAGIAVATFAEAKKGFNAQVSKALDAHAAPLLGLLTKGMEKMANQPWVARGAVGIFGAASVGSGLIKTVKYCEDLKKSWEKTLAFLNKMKIGSSFQTAWGHISRAASTTWGNLKTGFGNVKDWASSSATAVWNGMKSIGSGIGKAAVASWKFVASLWAQAAAWAATPIGMITIAVAALIGGAILLYKNWDKVTAFFKKFWGWIKTGWAALKSGLAAAWDWIKGLFSKVPGWVTWFFPVIKIPMLIIQNWTKIKAFFGAVLGWVKGLFGRIIDSIKEKVTAFKDAGVNMIKSIWEGIKSFVSKPIEAVKGMVDKIRKFLPFSPAKEGPLKDIHRIRLVETIAGGIKDAPLTKRIAETMAKAKKTLADSPLTWPAKALKAAATTALTVLPAAGGIKDSPLTKRIAETMAKAKKALADSPLTWPAKAIRAAAPALKDNPMIRAVQASSPVAFAAKTIRAAATTALTVLPAAAQALPKIPAASAPRQAPITINITIDAKGAAPGVKQDIEKTVLALVPKIEKALVASMERRDRASNTGRA